MTKTITNRWAIVLPLALFLVWGVFTKETLVINGNKMFDNNLELNEGMISPGHSPGKITVNGNFSMRNSATYKCELKDLSGAGLGHDQIETSGDISLDGTLDIVAIDGYTPDNGDQFVILKYGNAISGTFATVNGLPSDWQIDYGILNPNNVTIYGPAASPLPVELVNFRSAKKSNTVALAWETESEQNSDFFVVERSKDAIAYEAIGRVKAAGTSSMTLSYTFADSNPLEGVNYYRLKQVDLNGEHAWSKTLTEIYVRDEISFYPNPAIANITFSKPVDNVLIFDLSGKIILQKDHVDAQLDLDYLRPGVYLIDVNHGMLKQKLVVGK